MEPGRTNLTEAVRSVHQLKIEGYSATSIFSCPDYIKSTWNVSGYDWEVRFCHTYVRNRGYPGSERWVSLRLVLLGVPRGPGRKVRANLGCRLVDPSRKLEPSEMKNVSGGFVCSGHAYEILLMRSDDVPSSGYLNNDSLIVECTITVLKELREIVIPAQKDVPLPVPSSDLHQHLGELLQRQMGGDVTLVLAASGERFLAHKCILAARSPVFMAEFFGDMNERSSQCVRIEDMEAAAFKAMLHFIYTDTVPELDEEPESGVIMAQHLLAAADRYGLNRLKLICEGKLSSCIDVDTAATTLALAEQHNCSLLKAKCVEFVTASSEKLDAVAATEGYKHLVASCPSVLTELLKASCGRKN